MNIVLTFRYPLMLPLVGKCARILGKSVNGGEIAEMPLKAAACRADRFTYNALDFGVPFAQPHSSFERGEFGNTPTILESKYMSDVTRILSKMAKGDTAASEALLPLVYEELRRLAVFRMSSEQPGQTLQPTALVHEAYIRLVGSTQENGWDNRGHFFAAAAEAMRRILVDNARRKSRQMHGGEMRRHDVDQMDELSAPEKSDQILSVHESLEKLESLNPTAATLVKLRYFAGFTNREAAEMLRVSPRKATQIWTYARSWLLADMEQQT